MADARPSLIFPEVILAIDPAHTRALLVALRAPASLLRETVDAADLARRLFLTPLPADTTAALQRMVQLACPGGHQMLLEAAPDVPGTDASTWEDTRPADLAAILARMQARGEASAARCIERALLRLARLLPERVGYELVPRTVPSSLDPDVFASALGTLPAAAGEPWVAVDDDGSVHAAVRWRSEALAPGHVFVDLVSIHRDSGRVSIESARPSRIRAVAAALAEPMFGAARAFNDRPAFTLKSVLALGDEGLARAALPAGVNRVEVVACQLTAKSGARYEGRNDGPLAFVADQMAARGGYASRATFRFVLEGADEPVDAYVELPNRLGIRDARFRREVRAALTALGVLSPGVIGDDVATLASAAEWRLREVVGAEGLARMKALGLLIAEDPSRTIVVSTEGTRAWNLRTFALRHPLDRGRRYAFADDLSVPARSVGDEDRAMFRLDMVKLATTLREDLGLAVDSPIELPQGVLDLGTTATEGARFRVLYVTTALPSEPERRRLGKALAKAALPGHALVLVPRGRRLDHGLEVELDLAEQLGLTSLRPKVALALSGIRGAAEAALALAPVASKPDEKRAVHLTITGERRRKRTLVLVDGKEVELPDLSFALLVELAASHLASPGAWLDRRTLDIEGNHNAPSRLRSDLRAALPPGLDVLENDGDRYRLSSSVAHVEIDWPSLRSHPAERVRKLANARPRHSR